jgi:PrgI family protein
MAMYQIPQFLDQGDKVFFGMNFIQLIIFLVGFMLTYATYTIFNGIFKFFLESLGQPSPEYVIFAFIPAIPLGLMTFYLCLGKFNGRDTYTYGAKFFKSLIRNPKIVYRRRADLSDLEAKFGSLNLKEKEKELEERYQALIVSNKRSYATADNNTKAEFIRNLGSELDDNYVNTSINLVKQSQDIAKKQQLLADVSKKIKRL